MNVALQANNLNIGYQDGSKTLLVAGPLKAELNKGELACIMGPNGIGKSTFIRTIAGIQNPISGTVVINKVNIHQVSNKERAKLLSVVLTGRPTSNFMTVRDLVELGRYPHTNWQHTLAPEDKLIVDQAIEAVGLVSDSEKLVAELSDGNAQKAMIARALAQDAELLVLDEPTIHLDLRNKLMVLELLADLSKKYDKSILLASHDLNMMSQLADKLWLFQEDKIIIGIPEDLMNNGIVEEILGTETYTPPPASLELAVSIKGNSGMTYWLERALKRNGYAVTGTADIMIIASEKGLAINNGQKQEVFSSIEATLAGLKRYYNE
jgi:iron complex transport system ATP-binding protein